MSVGVQLELERSTSSSFLQLPSPEHRGPAHAGQTCAEGTAGVLVAEILFPDDIYLRLRLVARLRATQHGVCRGPSSPPTPSRSILRALRH